MTSCNTDVKDCLEGRQCPNCDTWFTIVKTDSQKLCYDCDMENQPTGDRKLKKCKHGSKIIKDYCCKKCVYEVFGKFPENRRKDLIRI